MVTSCLGNTNIAIQKIAAPRVTDGAQSRLTRVTRLFDRNLLILVPLVLCCACTEKSDRQPVIQPVAYDLTASMEPVRIDLYKYKNGDGSRNNFQSVGKPVQFVFPASYLVYRENRRGGPQALISLLVDRESMQPLGKVISDDISSPTSMKLNIGQRSYKNRESSIEIYSQFISGTWSSGLKARPVGSHDRDDLRAICPSGNDISNKEDFGSTIDRTSVIDSPHGRLHSDDLLTRVDTPVGISQISCAKKSPICVIYFDYRGLTSKFAIYKDRICQYPTDLINIKKFLDHHFVNIDTKQGEGK